jgi:hypothetical protein
MHSACVGVRQLSFLQCFISSIAEILTVLLFCSRDLYSVVELGLNTILLLVRQKFSAFSVNSVVFLTASSILLAFHTSGDRPEGVTSRQYVLGVVLMVGVTSLYGFVIPLIELTLRYVCMNTFSNLQIILFWPVALMCYPPQDAFPSCLETQISPFSCHNA